MSNIVVQLIYKSRESFLIFFYNTDFYKEISLFSIKPDIVISILYLNIAFLILIYATNL